MMQLKVELWILLYCIRFLNLSQWRAYRALVRDTLIEIERARNLSKR